MAKRPYMTKEQKGELVLEALLTGPATLNELCHLTGMNAPRVRAGIDWLRDYAEYEPIVYDAATHKYAIAEQPEQVEEHSARRIKSIYKQALRLERIIAVALRLWPDSRILRVMHKHLKRMREDIQDSALVEDGYAQPLRRAA